MAMADKERAAVGRCYDVDIGPVIGDKVEIYTHDEGTVQGEVTDMCCPIAFRTVDTYKTELLRR